MEFINKLVETDESTVYKNVEFQYGTYEDMGFRQFEAIRVNDTIWLSIQASYGHYCSPRKTLSKELYTNMELAIFKNDEFAPVSSVTKNEELINKFDEYYEGTVYGYVPVELIEELYQDLNK